MYLFFSAAVAHIQTSQLEPSAVRTLHRLLEETWFGKRFPAESFIAETSSAFLLRAWRCVRHLLIMFMLHSVLMSEYDMIRMYCT
jgi:hypothetical protein